MSESESTSSSNTSSPEGTESQAITKSAVEQVVETCPKCKGQVDVTSLSPFTGIECPHCSEPFNVRSRLGNYQIQGMLGEGGMSQVFRAIDITLNRAVALKILHQTLSEDASLTAMFEREATLTASINHPNVVKVYTASSDRGYFYIAMELVDTVSIEQVIAADGAIPEARVLDMAYDVTNGLRAAFGEGLIHRDIKPGNMLVTDEGVAKLVDFGLALHQDGVDDLEELWATPFYVPPEKLDGEPDTFLGDIYSLGATFYHALAGVPPFEANTFSLDELKEIKAKNVSLRTAAPHISKATLDLVEKMMAYRPEDRPQSYEELLQLIEATLEVVPGTTKKKTRAVSDGSKAFSPAMKRGLIGGAIALFIGVLIILIAIFGGGDSDIDDNLITGGERVIGGEGISAKFNEGREALAQEKWRDAEAAFSELANVPDLQQPTLGWIHFNQGLLNLLSGNELTARGYFQKLKSMPPLPDNATESMVNQAAFFKSVAGFACEPLPVLEEDAAQVAGANQGSLGLLISGLKNWNHQEFASAKRLLSQYADSPIPAGYSWTSGLHNVAKSFVSDADLIDSLPRPTGDATVSELKQMEKLLTDNLEKTKTRGVAPKFIRARIRRCQDIVAFSEKATELASLAGKERTGPKGGTDPPNGKGKGMKGKGQGTGTAGTDTPSSEWTEAEKQEIAVMESAIEEAEGLAAAYEFSAALLKVESITIESERTKAIHQDVLATYREADLFLSRFISEMSGGTYEGIVRRKSGRPLDAKITAASRDELTVNLGFGDNPLALKEFEPDWIREAAEETLLKSDDNQPDVAPELWQQAACFAAVSGMVEHADRLAKVVRPLVASYNDQWGRMSEVELFGLLPPPPPEAEDEDADL